MTHDDLAPFREQIESDVAAANKAHHARVRPNGILDLSLIESSHTTLAADIRAAYAKARK